MQLIIYYLNLTKTAPGRGVRDQRWQDPCRVHQELSGQPQDQRDRAGQVAAGGLPQTAYLNEHPGHG